MSSSTIAIDRHGATLLPPRTLLLTTRQSLWPARTLLCIASEPLWTARTLLLTAQEPFCPARTLPLSHGGHFGLPEHCYLPHGRPFGLLEPCNLPHGAPSGLLDHCYSPHRTLWMSSFLKSALSTGSEEPKESGVGKPVGRTIQLHYTLSADPQLHLHRACICTGSH